MIRSDNYFVTNRGIKKGVIFILAAIISLFVPMISRVVLYYLQLNVDSFSNVPVLVFIFYLCQLILGLLLLNVVKRVFYKEQTISLRLSFKSLGWVLKYLSVWSAVVLGFYTFSHFFNPNFLDYVESWWSLDKQSFSDDILTICLQAGAFEEPFFRGVIAQMILWGAGMSYQSMNRKMKFFVVFFNGFLFSIAHVYYNLFPFQMLPLDVTQLVTTLIVGSVITHYYYKNQNLLGPILAHTGGNIIQVMTGYGYILWLSL